MAEKRKGPALLPDMINASGRAPLVYFIKLAAELGERKFAEHLRCPFLAGTGIREGALSSSQDQLARMQAKTMAFTASELFGLEEGARPSESLKEAIYPLTKGPHGTSGDPLKFTIGRIAGNDMVIPDFAISKQHAVIQLAERAYLIKDLGSSNGTLVNDQPAQKPVKLEVGDRVCFARYEFTFVSPELLYSILLARALGKTAPKKK